MVDDLLGRALARVLPVRCHGCGAATAGPAMCRACAASLPWNEPACRACASPLATPAAAACGACLQSTPPHDRAWAAFRYEPPVAGQILGLKFHARLSLSHVLGSLMADRLAARALPMPELLVPVPLHASRLRRRGYNQALEIARQLSRRLSIPVAAAAARRVRITPEQSRLPAGERRRNLRNAFEVGSTVRGRHIALIDDVITTGATAAELSRAARRAGARAIEVWAVARTA